MVYFNNKFDFVWNSDYLYDIYRPPTPKPVGGIKLITFMAVEAKKHKI